jgi:glycosyltransferase involved in cell wall biosynthesis
MLALEPAGRRAVGAAGRAHILSRFTWDRVADRLAETYASVRPS